MLSGIDQNNNNILDESGIQNSKYICNGESGSNSLASLVPEQAGANCPTGGYKINTGVDANKNNILDASEVQNSQYVCNGLSGGNSLVALAVEPAGQNCSNGGYKVNGGADLNRNGILDNTEIQQTSYVCNGNDGLNYLISVRPEGAGTKCIYGGYSFNTGIDGNKNGILDNSEITKTDYVCSEAPLSEVRLPLIFYGTTKTTTGDFGLALSNFNKANYPGLDSIAFVGRPYVEDPNNFSIVELINLTDNVIWEDSRITSNKTFTEKPLLTSKNLYSIIPNKAIDIGLKIRSKNEGTTAGVNIDVYLVLNKKK